MENLLKDPDMEEAVAEFIDESNDLIEKMEDILEQFEDDTSNTALLEKFGQQIDRIMGAAKSLGADKTGTICELGKIIGYKSSQSNDQTLLQIVCGFLFDTIEVLQELIDSIDSSREENIKSFNIDKFIERLIWLKDKFSHIERASVAIGNDAVLSDINQLKNLLKG